MVLRLVLDKRAICVAVKSAEKSLIMALNLASEIFERIKYLFFIMITMS